MDIPLRIRVLIFLIVSSLYLLGDTKYQQKLHDFLEASHWWKFSHKTFWYIVTSTKYTKDSYRIDLSGTPCTCLTICDMFTPYLTKGISNLLHWYKTENSIVDVVGYTAHNFACLEFMAGSIRVTLFCKTFSKSHSLGPKDSKKPKFSHIE